MIAISLHDLAVLLGASYQGPETVIDSVTIDSRHITAGCLFIAIKGDRFDGHDFVEQAARDGAAAVVVSEPPKNPQTVLSIPHLIVKDTRLALGTLAAWVRQQVPTKVVALTGSSGKTTVKEMTAAILRYTVLRHRVQNQTLSEKTETQQTEVQQISEQVKGEVLATAGNLNNDIGVPLTLLRLTCAHQFAVVELGANHIGEIAYTSELAKPQAALVNNLAAAHLEGFGSLAGVAQAKGEVFSSLPLHGIAIVNAESHDLSRWQPSLVSTQTLWQFSVIRDDVDFYASQRNSSPQGNDFVLHTPQGQIAIVLPLPGNHNIANALAAAALAMAAGANLSDIQAGLSQAQAVAGRLFPIVLAPNKRLIDDSYNANVGSMTAAAAVLAQMPGYRVMVVGDMAELGADALQCHQQVGEAIFQQGIDKVLTVGKLSQEVSRTSQVGEHFDDKTTLIARLHELLSEQAVITVLIKGSRSAAMEQVVRALQEKASC